MSKTKKSIEDYSAASIMKLEQRVQAGDSDAAAELSQVEGYEGVMKLQTDLFVYGLSKEGFSLKEFKAIYGYEDDHLAGIDIQIPKMMAESHKRKRKPRRDAVERVALARYLLDTLQVDNATTACKRVGTHIGTFNKYYYLSKVEALLKRLNDDPKEATKLRQTHVGKQKRMSD